jgi:hypothetical protein
MYVCFRFFVDFWSWGIRLVYKYKKLGRAPVLAYARSGSGVPLIATLRHSDDVRIFRKSFRSVGYPLHPLTRYLRLTPQGV